MSLLSRTLKTLLLVFLVQLLMVQCADEAAAATEAAGATEAAAEKTEVAAKGTDEEGDETEGEEGTEAEDEEGDATEDGDEEGDETDDEAGDEAGDEEGDEGGDEEGDEAGDEGGDEDGEDDGEDDEDDEGDDASDEDEDELLVDEMLAEYDKDKDGKLSKTELLDAKPPLVEPSSGLEAAFIKADADKDSLINRDELKLLVKALEEQEL